MRRVILANIDLNYRTNDLTFRTLAPPKDYSKLYLALEKPEHIVKTFTTTNGYVQEYLLVDRAKTIYGSLSVNIGKIKPYKLKDSTSTKKFAILAIYLSYGQSFAKGAVYEMLDRYADFVVTQVRKDKSIGGLIVTTDVATGAGMKSAVDLAAKLHKLTGLPIDINSPEDSIVFEKIYTKNWDY